MRKVIIIEYITLDGVIQAAGGSKEDAAEGFKYGGWQGPYFDNVTAKEMEKQMKEPFSLLLGRKTYDIFAGYWPEHEEFWAGVNSSRKYVVTKDPSYKLKWDNSVLITGDVVEEIKKLKAEKGPDLKVWGSANLIQTLLKNDLVDELWLKIFPITLGTGKRLFVEGTIPVSWKLTSCKISPKGVIIAYYKRAGEIKPGSLS